MIKSVQNNKSVLYAEDWPLLWPEIYDTLYNMGIAYGGVPVTAPVTPEYPTAIIKAVLHTLITRPRTVLTKDLQIELEQAINLLEKV